MKKFQLLVYIFLLLLISSLIPLKSMALQADAPYLVLEKKMQGQWDVQDKQIKQKLKALEAKYGKKPNIIIVLADDIGWGELGSYLGGKLRRTPTPQLDKMAAEGMQLLSHYSEPSCTPSRIALMTGRYPVRTGLTDVLWPGQKAGLSPKEVTIAELLSAGGYHTAMWGRWPCPSPNTNREV